MTDTINKDQYICEKLGICYEHDWISMPYSNEDYKCRECGVEQSIPLPASNFTTDPGKVRLLREIGQCEEFHTYIYRGEAIGFINPRTGSWYVNSDLITDTTGKLRDAVWEWLKEGER